MNSCLITGATGLIGHAVIDNYLKDWDIYAITRKKDVDFSTKVNVIQHDFTSKKDIDQLPKKIDVIIHLALSDVFSDFPNNASDIFSVNTVSTQYLLDYARKINVRTFILASTGSVYGNGIGPFTETSVTGNNLDFYPVTKLCSEKIAETYNKIMNIIILRPFYVYGPYQNSRRLIPRLIRSVKEGQPIVLQGSEGIKINPIYISDAAKVIARVVELNDSEIINIGGREVLSIKEIGEIIGNFVNKKPIFEVHQNETPNNIIGDITKMSQLLWKPEITLKAGIKKMLEASRKKS